ncbi:hypothetical protein BGX38DRAFT_1264946 [Terfezia claveryi]|nr:hypothetical protein BGX38DRAFT_1264946 [Terfezia claveryi]
MLINEVKRLSGNSHDEVMTTEMDEANIVFFEEMEDELDLLRGGERSLLRAVDRKNEHNPKEIHRGCKRELSFEAEADYWKERLEKAENYSIEVGKKIDEMWEVVLEEEVARRVEKEPEKKKVAGGKAMAKEGI